MENCRKQNNIDGYGAIEKHLILDFINNKQREEREREARHNAYIAIVKQVSVLEEQVRTLKEQSLNFKEQVSALREANASSAADARKAHTQSLIANFIPGMSIAIAILALVLRLN